MGAVAGVSGLVSHDFYEGQLTGLNPDPEWIWVDPYAGTSPSSYGFEGALSSNAYLTITVPAGDTPAHDYWGAFECPVLCQAVSGNFTVEISCPEIVPATTSIGFGIMTLDSLVPANVVSRLYCGVTIYQGEHHFESGNAQSSSAWTDNTLLGNAPTHPLKLQLIKAGSLWTTKYRRASDPDWITADSNVNDSATVTHVGLFSANFGNEYSGHTRKFDYFFEATNPVTQEDTFSSSRRIFIIS
jgi:hypothetical protein